MWRREFKAYPEVITREYVTVTLKGNKSRVIYLDTIQNRAARIQIVSENEVHAECRVRLYDYKTHEVLMDQVEKGSSIKNARAQAQKLVANEMEKYRKSDAEIEADEAQAGADRQAYIDFSEKTEAQLIEEGIISGEAN